MHHTENMFSHSSIHAIPSGDFDFALQYENYEMAF